MTTHSSVLAWNIPWPEEPGRLQSTGSQRVGHFYHDWSFPSWHLYVPSQRTETRILLSQELMEREWGLESNLATWLPCTAGPRKVQTLSLPCLVRKMRLTTTVVHKVLLGLNDGKGNGNPLPYSCLENPIDRGAWQAAVGSLRVRQDWVT